MSREVEKPLIWEIRTTLFNGNFLAGQCEEILLQNRIRRIVSVVEKPSQMPSEELLTRLDLWHAAFQIHDWAFDYGVGEESAAHEVCKEVFPWIKEAEDQGESVLIHCRRGASRSPAMTIAYLVWRGNEFDEALAIVAHANKISAPKPQVLRSFLSHIGRELPPNYETWLKRRMRDVTT